MAKSEQGPKLDALYETDAFRMFCYKVLPCSQHYQHEWTECPFRHPGERAARRDPRRCHYSGVACPAYKQKGACNLGEHCPYAHSVFEYWLHTSRYRTQLCCDGAKCARRICFFAHSLEQLRSADKPWVAPEAVMAAAAAAATAREGRSAAGDGQPPLRQVETEEEEQQQVVESVTWLLSSGRFTTHQAALLLDQLLPPGVLSAIQQEMGGHSARGGGGGSSRGGGTGQSVLPLSDPLGARRHCHQAPAGPQTRFSLGSSPGPAAAFALAAAAAPAQSFQELDSPAWHPGAAAFGAAHVPVGPEAQRMLAAMLERQASPHLGSPASPYFSGAAASAHFGPPATPHYSGAAPLRHSLGGPLGAHGSLAPLPERASLDARLEADLCAAYAALGVQGLQGLDLRCSAPHASPLAPQLEALQQQHFCGALPPPPNRWGPAAMCGEHMGGLSVPPGQAQQLSMDSVDGGRPSMEGSRRSMDSRFSMDSATDTISVHTRHSADVARQSAELAWQSAELAAAWASLESSALSRPHPPPSANPFTSSFFAPSGPS